MKLCIVVVVVLILIHQSCAWPDMADPAKRWEVMGYFKVGCPCGMISMWFGEIDTIPSGYTLCDGDLGTPDLTNKFIVAAGTDVGDFALGDTGGADTITIGVANLPAHNHGIAAQATSVDPHGHGFVLGANNDAGSVHSHAIGQQTSDPEDPHDHVLSDAFITIITEPDHSHVIPAATTATDGDHAHVMQAFADKDVPAGQKVTGIKAEQILDGAEPLNLLQHGGATLVDTTMTDGAHQHGIPAGNTGDAGNHTHGINGLTDLDGGHAHTIPGHNTNNDGGHTHGVSGTIGPDSHGHFVSGATEPTGDGEDIVYLPPYYAVYFICCVREPGTW